MTQMSLDRQVAKATGESVATIRRMGFSIACPPRVEFDPEPNENSLDMGLGFGLAAVDWDEIDAQRMRIFPVHYGRGAA